VCIHLWFQWWDCVLGLSGVFHTAQEEQSGDISARLSPLNDDHQLVDGSQVRPHWTVWVDDCAAISCVALRNCLVGYFQAFFFIASCSFIGITILWYILRYLTIPSVLWRCWVAGRASGLWKTEWRGAGVVVCLEQGVDLRTSQLMPRPLTVSCFSKIQTGFTLLVPAHPGSPGKRTVKPVCV